jgi:hypothetical protein
LNIPNHPETGGEPPSDPWCRPGDAYGHLRLRIAPTMVDYDYIDLRILREQQRAH